MLGLQCLVNIDRTHVPIVRKWRLRLKGLPALILCSPFLQFVSDVQSFDQRLSQYVTTNYIQLKYQQLLGCNNVNLTNTTSLYARYTTSVICNAIVQNSITPCSLSSTASRPLCAETCVSFRLGSGESSPNTVQAQQATSEEEITVDSQLCDGPNADFLSQIRADFTNCALPSNSLSQQCITGEENEPNSCGFSTNLQGLCGYCASSSPNATDSCCAASNVTNKCTGVTLPSTSSLPPLFPSSTGNGTSSATGAPAVKKGTNGHHGLSGGQIAAIVIGSVLGALLLIGLLVLLILYIRRRRGSQKSSVFNQPSPPRRGEPNMSLAPGNDPSNQLGYGSNPVGRVTRMSALEGTSSDSHSYGNVPAVAGTFSRDRGHGETSDSDMYGNTPESRGGKAPPTTGRRNGSLSGQSMLGFDDSSSPHSGHNSSPEGLGSGQSEQLANFKDYYSQDDIRPGDTVATLWAYQPRAGDEFELERGDMLRVVGIWDDGWATGVRVNERAEDYLGKHKIQRDSGVSNGYGGGQSPTLGDEVKAFPILPPTYCEDASFLARTSKFCDRMRIRSDFRYPGDNMEIDLIFPLFSDIIANSITRRRFTFEAVYLIS
ncbi:MAG: hypothetical protein Q9191_006150 [Dirinaria sp. TL-2023a]